MRQPLKKLHEIFEPDPRSEAFTRMDGAGFRHQTIDDYYADISAATHSPAARARIGPSEDQSVRKSLSTCRMDSV